MDVPQWLSKYPRLNSAIGFLLFAQGLWALFSEKPLLPTIADWFGWVIMIPAPYLFYVSLGLGAFGLFLLVATYVNTTPTLKKWISRSTSDYPALPHDPHVIISCDSTKPRKWNLSSANASAFNVTSDPIGTNDLYARIDAIHEIKANQSVGVQFLVHDKKNQIENHPLLWLDSIFDYSASKTYQVCVHYRDAAGQNFRSEAKISWDGPTEGIKIAHERILRVSS
jgi:hypothetical protein